MLLLFFACLGLGLGRLRQRAISGGFFLFREFCSPDVFAQPDVMRHGFGFANADLAALGQELLDQGIIRGGFRDFFHLLNLWS